MGCCCGLRLWRRRKNVGQEVEVDCTAPARPYQGTDGMLYDDEKPPIALGRVTVPARVAVRPHVNPTFSAYSTPMGFKTQDEKPYHQRQFYPPAKAGTFNSTDSTLTPSTPHGGDNKWKEDDVDDPEAERRRRKAEEARRKAEQEEQERLDFFQML